MNARELPSVPVMQATALRVYEIATAAEWHEGFAWPDMGQVLCATVGASVGSPADHVACMIAAGSGKVNWDQQAELAEQQARVILAGLPLRMIPGYPLTNRQRQQMHDCLLGGPSRLSGRKVVDFAGLLTGDKYAKPIDCWNVRGLLGRYIPYKDTGDLTDLGYWRMQEAVDGAARKLGMWPARLIGIMWTVSRNRGKELEASLI